MTKKKAYCRDFERLTNALSDCGNVGAITLPADGSSEVSLDAPPGTDAMPPGTVEGGYETASAVFVIDNGDTGLEYRALHTEDEDAHLGTIIYRRWRISGFDADGNPETLVYERIDNGDLPALDDYIAGKVNDAFVAMEAQLTDARSWMDEAKATVDAQETVDNSAIRNAIIAAQLSFNSLGSAFAETMRAWADSAGRKA